MGINDAREQLEVCKDEYGKLEREVIRLRRENAELRAKVNAAPVTITIGSAPGSATRPHFTEEEFQREAWRRGMH